MLPPRRALNEVYQNSEVDMAIVHNDDYITYCQHLQAGSLPPSDLILHRVKDGLAFGKDQPCRTSVL